MLAKKDEKIAELEETIIKLEKLLVNAVSPINSLTLKRNSVKKTAAAVSFALFSSSVIVFIWLIVLASSPSNLFTLSSNSSIFLSFLATSSSSFSHRRLQ